MAKGASRAKSGAFRSNPSAEPVRGGASSARVPVLVMGLGAIGQQIARAALANDEVELIGAVDSSPQLAGRLLSEVIGQPAGALRIQPSMALAAGRRKGVVLLHATGSRLPQVKEQLLEAISHGFHVVSTCEELAFPWFHHSQIAETLDAAAQRAGVSVLGTGVNPGFVLDRLVATVGQVCGSVRHARVARTVDARTRREALQRKVGVGLSEAEFFALVDQNRIGHVGLVESAALCALGLGLDCDDFEEELTPVFATDDLRGAFNVKKGQVAGMHQVAVALEDGQERVRLELTIALGADDPGDVIELDADSKVKVLIPGGIAGDSATAHLVVNAAPRMTASQAGVLTVLELPAGR